MTPSVHSQAWLMVVAAALSACAGNLLLKKTQMISPHLGLIASFNSFWFFSALIFMVFDLLLFSKALRMLPISLVYPVFSGILFTSLLLSAALLLGESFQPIQLLGIGAIVFGIMLVARYS